MANAPRRLSPTERKLQDQTWREIAEGVALAAEHCRSGETQKQYRAQQLLFCRWAQRHGHRNPLPIRQPLLLAFFASLALAGLKSNTLRSYKTGLNALHRERGWDQSVFASPAVKDALRGWERLQQSPTVPRSPFSLQQLRELLAVVDQTSLVQVRDATLMTFFFFGMFRKAELTYKKKERPYEEQLLLHGDVRDKGSYVAVMLRNAKTDKFGAGQLAVVPSRPGRMEDPVRWWRLYQRLLQKSLGSNDPAFPAVHQFSNSPMRPLRPLTDRAWGQRLAQMLDRQGWSRQRFSTHSFRIGGATALFLAGVATEIIMAMGRWRSDAFREYIRLHVSQLTSATRAIGTVADRPKTAVCPRALRLGVGASRAGLQSRGATSIPWLHTSYAKAAVAA